jgi:hypothetical protein
MTTSPLQFDPIGWFSGGSFRKPPFDANPKARIATPI